MLPLKMTKLRLDFECWFFVVLEEEPEMEAIDPFADFVSSDYGFLVSVLFFIIFLNILIYTLSIVWRCYKFILRRNRENMRRVNNLANGGGTAHSSFWGPDGSVNPPVSANWLSELEPDEVLSADNPDGSGNLVFSHTSNFKLPKYSEVAKDPEGKKFLIVNMPQTSSSPGEEPASTSFDDPPSFSRIAEDCPPPPLPPDVAESEPSALNRQGTPHEDRISLSDPPPSYEDAKRDDVPELTEFDSPVEAFNGTLQIDENVDTVNSNVWL